MPYSCRSESDRQVSGAMLLLLSALCIARMYCAGLVCHADDARWGCGCVRVGQVR